MVTLSELLQVSLLKKFNLVAGHKGLNNILSNVVILEYESVLGSYEDFNEGDFVLTSLFFAKEKPDLIKEAFENLIGRGISGIAIKTVYFDEIDDEIKSIANRNNIPVFTFNSIYMEDIIININDFIKKSAHYFIIERKVKNILKSNLKKDEVLKIAKEIYPLFNENIICAYVERIEELGEQESFREFNKILYRKLNFKNFLNYLLIKYKKGFFIVYHYSDKTIKRLITEKLDFFINSLLIDKSLYRIGINDNLHKIDELDVSLKKSVYTLKMAEYNELNCFLYSKLKEDCFILVLLENKLTNEYFNECIKIMTEYDKKYNSNLLHTIIMYVECNGNIKKTSDKLYQHQNTVRYRINKIKVLLKIKNDKFFFSQSYILVSMYKINNFLK